MSRFFNKQYPGDTVLKDGVRGAIFLVTTASPTSANLGAPGALLVDDVNGVLYQNTGTLASPTWSQISAAGGTFATLTITTLTSTTVNVTNLNIAGTTTIADNKNIVLNATTGTQLGTAANQKLSVWGATPIIQPSGTGLAVGEVELQGNNIATAVYVTNNSTFNGNSGSKAYNVSDIVRALKNAGILAAS